MEWEVSHGEWHPALLALALALAQVQGEFSDQGDDIPAQTHEI